MNAYLKLCWLFVGVLLSVGFTDKVCAVNLGETDCDEECCWDNAPRNSRSGVWLPEGASLFPPFLADPHRVCPSTGWRFDDRIFDVNTIDVSYADNVPIYRWFNVGARGSLLQLELEGALWALFEPTLESSPLVNADYYVGGVLTYAYRNWSFRLRGFHISSHLGDEFLLNMQIEQPEFKRLNPSAEYIDLAGAYVWNEDVRLYAGIGCVVHDDKSFPWKGFYSLCGFEHYLPFFRFYDDCDRIGGSPFQALHLHFQTTNSFSPDLTYVLGYELCKFCGLARALRFFGEYHNGFSVEGQFAKTRTRYYALRFSYGF